jgi:hypothetical protein
MTLPEALLPFSAPAEIDARTNSKREQLYEPGKPMKAGSFVARLQFAANPTR